MLYQIFLTPKKIKFEYSIMQNTKNCENSNIFPLIFINIVK